MASFGNTHWKFLDYFAWCACLNPGNTQVVVLYLSDSRISTVLEQVGLTTLTSEIVNLPNLKKIILSRNNITSIPAEIAKITPIGV